MADGFPARGDWREGDIPPFPSTLERQGLSLLRGPVRALQINTGFRCNLRCRHCHLAAGPERNEVMSRPTMEAVIAFARRFPVPVLDVTGGAPEMVPGLSFLLKGLAPLAPRLLLRSNLTGVEGAARDRLIALCASLRVALVMSFPSPSASQSDGQRGRGFLETSVGVLRHLNREGYGVEGSGLELDLVSNPAGAYLPPSQEEAQERFRRELLRKWGIRFNRLFTFANVPVGRFREWLLASGNGDRYLRTLWERFNPSTVEGLMCRTQLSVSWDGLLYDCDFNLALGRPLGERGVHVSEVGALPPPGAPVAMGDYCYACTAGSGFT